ncbi:MULTISPECIES: PPOX class F420-dependent oxidoreductase [unclassified Mycolicibacterium]|uniref:PPOX class F420-dependent oxidoreductase n=1 Tax=unclassified Mycolicibacterium TaxID=2636767 RepID=UPI0012DDBA29|nr:MULTISPECIES: PPOX class F420-dependent oxidoreductase [unclassified Mycolicibacterium]MUL81149.1 PPOX class F420-dependent oxidoreductase [Mycolicibacterium sp. CBMA 329]MUL86915.1 PPOX class F420-dependent oxidoreductase [Mycolicibacterium sp. CBMA 331]MUL98801.1 PPOX class F420-dependent oxidoreductase [Mycolicibacterium sp. CBMA 334]MUM30148.1 PPOX class F420-dependent oxidoreductase [Mycolicibacterium sp. CBMA 295]MUM37212.1 PPOX class F420-dependent oxidoreductase [Mycolicibacterium s
MPNEPGTLAHTFSRMMFRGMDKMRHRDAFGIGAPTGSDFAEFANYHQIVLVSFKRSGEAVPSPINHGVADGKLYVRTDASTGKVKRIRNNANVLVVACNLRGRPSGPVVAGVARILPEAEHAHADAVIAANWSAPMKVLERSLDYGSQTLGVPMAFIEITPAGE